MTNFSDEDTEKFIELIKQNPVLFDPRQDYYKDDKFRDNIWKGIAESVNKTDYECRKKWKLLKDTYNRCKRKQKHTMRSRFSQWQFFEPLKFLDDIKPRTEGSEEIEFVQVTPTSDVGATPGTSTSEPDRPRVRRANRPIRKILRRKRPDDVFTNLLKERHERSIDDRNNEVQVPSVPQQPIDEIASFSKHIEMSLRNMSVRSRAMAKNEIFNIITKYEMADIDGQNESTYSTSLTSFSSYSPLSTTSFKTEQQTESDLIEFSSQ